MTRDGVNEKTILSRSKEGDDNLDENGLPHKLSMEIWVWEV